jgi:hypothetical protein
MSIPSTALPRFGRVSDSKSRCGLSRSTLYEIAADYKDIFRKHGNVTIVDYHRVERVLENLPLAAITVGKAKK